jgi:hypothetical protein
MQCLILGEEGRGRKRVIIPFHASFSEEADNYEIGRTRKGAPKIIQTIQTKPSEGWIARINCYYTYTRNTRGYYEIIAGNIEEVAAGFGAFGTAGRIGSWDDALVVVKPPFPAIVKIYPSGGKHKVLPYYLVFYDDRVDKVKEDEWEVYSENVPCL